MGILVGKNTKVIVQGITGKLGSSQTELMLSYGTKIVAGITPGKSGQTICRVPVYDSVKEAMKEHEVDASVLYVPAPFMKEAAFEAIEAGIGFLVIITDWVPFHDALEIKALARRVGTRYIGPNCPGIIVPGETSLGMMPPASVMPGNIGVASKSGTLTGEMALLLTQASLGQSTVIGVGGDPIIGMSFVDILKLFEEDKHTTGIILIGEIGGSMEEDAAEYIKEGKVSKPVVAFIAGNLAPPEKRMGHAGAIVARGRGTAQSKIRALEEAGVKVARTPWDLMRLMKESIHI